MPLRRRASWRCVCIQITIFNAKSIILNEEFIISNANRYRESPISLGPCIQRRISRTKDDDGV